MLVIGRNFAAVNTLCLNKMVVFLTTSFTFAHANGTLMNGFSAHLALTAIQIMEYLPTSLTFTGFLINFVFVRINNSALGTFAAIPSMSLFSLDDESIFEIQSNSKIDCKQSNCQHELSTHSPINYQAETYQQEVNQWNDASQSYIGGAFAQFGNINPINNARN